MASYEKHNRITFKKTRPNPLFQLWLEGLHKEAVENNSRLEPMLKEALYSLSKYPLPLKSGSDCAILKGFGKKLCCFLDQKLEEYKNYSNEDDRSNIVTKENYETTSDSESVDMPEVVINSSQTSLGAEDTPKKNHKKTKIYKPVRGSGGYAILVALYKHNIDFSHKPSLSKEELIERAQPYSEESFTRPKPDTYYTAWSNISKLITKGLVSKMRSKKVFYSLSEEGMVLAKELFKEIEAIPTVNDIIFKDASIKNEINKIPEVSKTAEKTLSATKNCENISNPDIEEIVMLSGTFDVILLIDKNETGGCKNKSDPTVAQFKKYPDLKHEYRSLKVGDFAWIAKSKIHNKELVLPYIVERKRMDDLGASIKDGRFHEQKFRLRKCGLKNVIYLVEHYGSNKHVGLPVQSLMQSLANTIIQDGFKVHVTDSLTHSARFLAMMTKRLTIEFKDRNLKGYNAETKDNLMTFEYFNLSSAKTKPLTVTETFIKILLQLKGMSILKALAIANVYKTPKSLIVKYKKCSEKEGEFLLANLKYDDLGRKVGPVVSKVVYQLLTNKELK